MREYRMFTFDIRQRLARPKQEKNVTKCAFYGNNKTENLGIFNQHIEIGIIQTYTSPNSTDIVSYCCALRKI